MKSDIENSKYWFQIEDDGGNEENATVFSLLPQIKNYQIPNNSDFSFYFRKKKLEFFVTRSYLYLVFFFLLNLLNIRDKKGSIYLYYGPWLERV